MKFDQMLKRMLYMILLLGVHSATSEKLTLDFVKDCCGGNCGRISAPLFLAPDGEFKEQATYHTIVVVQSNSTDNPGNFTDNTLCLAHIKCISKAIVNIAFTTHVVDEVQILESRQIYAEDRREDLPGSFPHSMEVTRGRTHNRVARSETPSRLGLKSFFKKDHRISRNKIFTLAVMYGSIKTSSVKGIGINMRAEKGTGGPIFFFILAAVAVVFVVLIVSYIFFRSHICCISKNVTRHQDPPAPLPSTGSIREDQTPQGTRSPNEDIDEESGTGSSTGGSSVSTAGRLTPSNSPAVTAAVKPRVCEVSAQPTLPLRAQRTADKMGMSNKMVLHDLAAKQNERERSHSQSSTHSQDLTQITRGRASPQSELQQATGRGAEESVTVD